MRLLKDIILYLAVVAFGALFLLACGVIMFIINVGRAW
jgi:hypothetical protein